MELRELTLQDLPSLRELYIQLDVPLETIPAEMAEETWKTEIENNKYIKYFGAVDNGKVVPTAPQKERSHINFMKIWASVETQKMVLCIN